jgi:hypothetical protein
MEVEVAAEFICDCCGMTFPRNGGGLAFQEIIDPLKGNGLVIEKGGVRINDPVKVAGKLGNIRCPLCRKIGVLKLIKVKSGEVKSK